MTQPRHPMPFDDEFRKDKKDVPRGGAEASLRNQTPAASADASRGTREEALGGPESGPRNDAERRRPMSLAEAGRRGGEARRSQLGQEGYSSLGRKGGEAVKAKYGPEFYREIGRKGGQRRVAQSRESAEPVGRDPQGLNFQTGATSGSAKGPARDHDAQSQGENDPQS